MEVVALTAPGDLAGLADAWGQLTRDSSRHDLFSDAGWFGCWVGAFNGDNPIRVYAAYEHGTLVGVLPTVLSRTRRRPWFSMHHGHGDDLERLSPEFRRGSLLPVRQLTPAAMLEAGSIRGSWITRPENARDVTRALLAAAARDGDWDMLVFSALPAEQADLLQEVAGSAGVHVHVSPGGFALFGLVPQAREAYMSGRNRHFRTRFNTAEKRLAQFGELRLAAHTCGPDLLAARDSMFALATRSWKESQRSGQKWFTPQSPRSQQFFSALIDHYARHDGAVIHELYVNDQLAASLLSIIVEDRIYALQTFYDARFAEGSPGRTLIMGLIDWSYHRGLAWVDMNSNSSLTQLFAREPMAFSQAWVFRQKGRSALLFRVMKRIDDGIRRLRAYKSLADEWRQRRHGQLYGYESTAMSPPAPARTPRPEGRRPYAGRFWKVSGLAGVKPARFLAGPRAPGFPFSHPGTVYAWNARAALWQGLGALGLQAGDRVWMPAYVCGSELDVLIARGLRPVFYPIRGDLTPDLDALGQRGDADIRALFVIHYFGFSQPREELVRFCTARGLLLIEDNAHGLFSRDADGTPLGSWGDMAIFSLYKSLPIPDGGALVLRGGMPVEKLHHPRWKRVLAKTRPLMERSLSHVSPRLTRLVTTRLLDPLAAWLKGTPDPRDQGPMTAALPAGPVLEYAPFVAEDGQTGMSSLSRHVAARVDAEWVVARRRAHYLELDQAIRRSAGPFRPLMTALADGCCPLFYPVLEDSPARVLRAAMMAEGVECHGFGFAHPALPESGFDWENTLKARVSCLPVHQELSSKDMERMLSVIRGFSGQPD